VRDSSIQTHFAGGRDAEGLKRRETGSRPTVAVLSDGPDASSGSQETMQHSCVQACPCTACPGIYSADLLTVISRSRRSQVTLPRHQGDTARQSPEDPLGSSRTRAPSPAEAFVVIREWQKPRSYGPQCHLTKKSEQSIA
jgi:hypothetical protein